MQTIQLLLAKIILLSCFGCSMAGGLVDKSAALAGLGPNEVKSIGVMAGAGQTPSALVVDVAFAYGDATTAVLTQSESSTWFREQGGFCRNYSNQLDVVRIELPMGYSALLADLPNGYELAQSIFVFVRGVGKADITKLSNPWIYVVNQELSILTAPPGATSSGNTTDAAKGAKIVC